MLVARLGSHGLQRLMCIRAWGSPRTWRSVAQIPGEPQSDWMAPLEDGETLANMTHEPIERIRAEVLSVATIDTKNQMSNNAQVTAPNAETTLMSDCVPPALKHFPSGSLGVDLASSAVAEADAENAAQSRTRRQSGTTVNRDSGDRGGDTKPDQAQLSQHDIIELIDRTETSDDIEALQRFIQRVSEFQAQDTLRRSKMKLLDKLTEIVVKYADAVAKAQTLIKVARRGPAEETAVRAFLSRVDKLLTATTLDAETCRELTTELARCRGLHREMLMELWQVSVDDQSRRASGDLFQAEERSLLQNSVDIGDMPAPSLPPILRGVLREGVKSRSGFSGVISSYSARGILDVQVMLKGSAHNAPHVATAVSSTSRSSQASSEPSEHVGPPAQHRSIILSNLPDNVMEQDIRDALRPCGEVSRVEICEEWLSEDIAQQRLTLRDATARLREFRRSYAIVEFETEEAHRHATKRCARLFGVLMPERIPTKSKAMKVVGRPAYPQDVRYKRSLLVHPIPWSAGLEEVLQTCAVAAASAFSCSIVRHSKGSVSEGGDYRNGEDNLRCMLRVTNGSAFKNALASPYVGVDLDAAVAFPPSCEDRKAVLPDRRARASGVDAIVLRFPSFSQAYLTRHRLRGLILGGISVRCGFSPERPKVCTVDSFGRSMDTPVLLDLCLPPSSARYDEIAVDPVVHFSVPADLENHDSFEPIAWAHA
eukprot:TRINITY_DN21150_c0_g1_i1.p1 TRINITY_DN21150_c0_g1~~TRINITY_DN21150_c0_g1_i1.p1  ORF type:complete len:711 (-),score=88.67 TRINITY_DN21150_c0_g1_i1:232-2364(-)